MSSDGTSSSSTVLHTVQVGVNFTTTSFPDTDTCHELSLPSIEGSLVDVTAPKSFAFFFVFFFQPIAAFTALNIVFYLAR